jgi:hypothetical protein
VEQAEVRCLGKAAKPGFKLRRITDWTTDHMVEEFNLGRLAEQAGISELL